VCSVCWLQINRYSQYVNLVLNLVVSTTSGWEMPAISSGLKVRNLVREKWKILN
jgi:hypothetical protein